MALIKKYLGLGTNSKQTLSTIASGPIIMKEGRVLLSKDGKDPFWKFPGGAIEDNESLRKAAVREAKEETGLDIRVYGQPLIFSFDTVKYNKRKYFILIHYMAEIIDDSGFLGEQEDRLKYFSLEELPEDIAPNIRTVIEHIQNQTYE